MEPSTCVRVALLSLCLLAGGCMDPAPGGVLPDLAQGKADLAPQDMMDCLDQTGDRGRGGVCIRSVEGRLVDENGQGLPKGATVTVCASACFFGMVADDGRFTVPVGQYLLADQYSLLIHVQPRRAAYYLGLSSTQAALGMGRLTFPLDLAVMSLPLTGPLILDDGSPQNHSNNGVTLTLPVGTSVTFSLEDNEEKPLGNQFRPLRVAGQGLAALPFVSSLPASQRPIVVYGFGPFDAVFSKPVRLSFANLEGLAPGTPLTLFAQRGLVGFAPPGYAFVEVATAKVSGDGKTIDMDPGAGIRTLTWIGLRPK